MSSLSEFSDRIVDFRIPDHLAVACSASPERQEWLARLPGALRRLRHLWDLTLGPPLDHDEVSCSWVAPVTRADGSTAVLKLGMPHMEAEHEADGLRFWAGDPTVRLLESDDQTGAMLLERCEPGSSLRELPEPEQDVVVADILKRLWRVPQEPHLFRPLSEMLAHWTQETMQKFNQWPDTGLVREGLSLFEELPRTATDCVLLATDLHAGNVLRAARQPWLAIDPKPFTGDPAYDATQHLLNCEQRMRTDAVETVRRFSDLAGLDWNRVRLWLFARAAAEQFDVSLARALAV